MTGRNRRCSMARKRQSKHTRKAAKRQRSTPSKPWVSPPPQTRPAIKISEAILTLAEPFRAHYREPHRLQAIIAIAVMAWNISLFPDEEHAHVQGMLLESLPPQLGGEDVARQADEFHSCLPSSSVSSRGNLDQCCCKACQAVVQCRISTYASIHHSRERRKMYNVLFSCEHNR